MEMLDPIVTSVSDYDEEEECKGSFCFVLSIVVQTSADMCPFQEASPRHTLTFLIMTRRRNVKVLFTLFFQLLSKYQLTCVLSRKPVLGTL